MGGLVQAPPGWDSTAHTLERLLDLRHAAIYEQFAAGDKTGVAGGKEEDRGGNLLRPPHRASRDERNEPVHGLLVP